MERYTRAKVWLSRYYMRYSYDNDVNHNNLLHCFLHYTEEPSSFMWHYQSIKCPVRVTCANYNIILH